MPVHLRYARAEGRLVKQILEVFAPGALDADLVHTPHGFDALLVLTGSTASANL